MSLGQELLHPPGEWIQAALVGIGAAIIVTDALGRVRFMNSMAEFMTGWSQGETRGQPLAVVFRIENEATRRLVTDSVADVLAVRNGHRPVRSHRPVRPGWDRVAHRPRGRPDPGCRGRRRRGDRDLLRHQRTPAGRARGGGRAGVRRSDRPDGPRAPRGPRRGAAGEDRQPVVLPDVSRNSVGDRGRALL
nr:PAS domain-containing protein [Fimbriiglobus ruber]